MNTGADVSYLLKAQQCLKESEDAERAGYAGLALDFSNAAIGWLHMWNADVAKKEAA